MKQTYDHKQPALVLSTPSLNTNLINRVSIIILIQNAFTECFETADGKDSPKTNSNILPLQPLLRTGQPKLLPTQTIN